MSSAIYFEALTPVIRNFYEILSISRNRFILFSNETKTIGPKQFEFIKTGVKFQMPTDKFATFVGHQKLIDRKMVIVPNYIDSSRTEEIILVVFNCSDTDTVQIEIGDKIANVLFDLCNNSGWIRNYINCVSITK